MATLDDVARLVESLPQVEEGQLYRNRSWSVAGKAFVWERPFSKADLKRFGDARPPGGDIVAVRTDGLDDKEAILAAHPQSCFTIPHFDGFSAVLVQLDAVGDDDLHELLADGWLVFAPTEVAQNYLGSGQ